MVLRMLRTLRSVEKRNVFGDRELVCGSFQINESSVPLRPEITFTGRKEQTCRLGPPRCFLSIKLTVNLMM